MRVPCRSLLPEQIPGRRAETPAAYGDPEDPVIKVGRFMRALQSGRFCGNPGGTAIDRPGGSSYREPPGFIVAGGRKENLGAEAPECEGT